MGSADENTTLSIDIGTTTVVAARTTGGEGPGDNTEIVVRMPAIVGVDGDKVLTGEAAARLATTHPDQTVSQLIRRLGDSSPIILDGRAFNISELLGHVVTDVVTQAAIEPASTRLVLTHPAAWKDHRLSLLTSLGTTQGFATVEAISDPVAATNPLTDTAPAGALVVDVGGGTVDASVVVIGAAGATVVATQSLERLGGNDFDQAVFGHVMASIDNMIADLDRRDPAVRHALAGLRANCTNAKECLSTDTDASVAVSVPGLDTAVRITRAEFESVIRPQVEAIVTLVDRVVASSGIETIDRVITTGGSAALPLIGETLSGHLGQSVAAGDDPATATALGAICAPKPPAITDHETQASTTTSPERGTTMNDDAPTTNDSATTGAAAPGGADAPGTRRGPIAPPPTAEKKGTSAGAKVAVGAAATAAAAAAAVVFGDDMADALGNEDGPDASVPPAETTDDGDDGMDEFDSIASGQTTAADVAGPAGVPLDSPIAARATVHQDRPGADRDFDRSDNRPAPNRPQPTQPPDAPDFAPGAQAPGAPAGAPTAGVAAAAAAATSSAPSDSGDAGDARFEAARATLLDRLENFEAPAGTSPEDAAALRQELADAVARFQPQPGQSTDAALAAMRDDFDQRVQDFVQDQKIDALVDEAERRNQQDAAEEAAAAAETTAPPVDPTVVDPAVADPTVIDPAVADPTVADPAATNPATVGIEVPDDDADPTLGDPVASDAPAADPPAADPPAADSGAGAALVDDFDTAAGRFQVVPDLIDTMATGTATLDSALLDTADTIGVGLLDADVIRATGPRASDIASGRESLDLGDAVSGDGGSVDGPLIAGGERFEPLIEVDVTPIARLDTDQIGRDGGGDDGDGDREGNGDEPGAVVQGDDFVGDSVYDAVVESPMTVIDVAAPDAILIGLDEPSPEGISIGIDQPAPGDIDVDGLQVRAGLPDDFVPPVYAAAEPFTADVPLVEETVTDFGIQGLEDEGNIPVDAAPDDMMDG